MCVTGQYHKGETKSTPTADADRRRIKRNETPSFTLVASFARASAVRSRRRTRRWIRPGGPADPGHGRAAMAWSGGRIGDRPSEPAHRRRAAEAPAMRTTILRYAANAGLIGAQALSTCYRKRDGAIFDLRRCEFIPLLGAAAVYPSPANMQEKIDAAVRPRRVCTT